MELDCSNIKETKSTEKKIGIQGVERRGLDQKEAGEEE